VSGIGPVADPYALGKIGNVVGLNPAAVQQAFHLQSPAEAVALLGGDAGALGATVAPVAQTERPNTTLHEGAADPAWLDRLNQTRNQLIANVNVKLGRSR